MENKKGQTVAEALLCMPLVGAALLGFFYLLYFSTVYFLISYKAQETLFCLNQRSENICLKEFRQFSKKTSCFNEQVKARIFNTPINKFNNVSTIQVQIQFLFHQLEITHYNEN